MKKKYLIYITSFCILILLISIFLLICDLININQYLNLSKEYDWLAYIGTVLAGIGTMLGIYFTFSQSQDIEKNNVKPWIKISTVDSETSDIVYFFFHTECGRKLKGHSFTIKIENGGNRELTNLRMYETKKDGFYQDAGPNGFVTPGLNSGENIILEINYYYPENYTDKHYSGNRRVYNNLILFFDDCYGNSYYQKFNIDYTLGWNETKTNIKYKDIVAKASSSPIPYNKKVEKQIVLAEQPPEEFYNWH